MSLQPVFSGKGASPELVQMPEATHPLFPHRRSNRDISHLRRVHSSLFPLFPPMGGLAFRLLGAGSRPDVEFCVALLKHSQAKVARGLPGPYGLRILADVEF